MALNPIPYVVTQSDDVENAPPEAIPIVLHGGGGGGGGDLPDTYSGDVSEAVVAAENPENPEQVITVTLKQLLIQATHTNHVVFSGQIGGIQDNMSDILDRLFTLEGRVDSLEEPPQD